MEGKKSGGHRLEQLQSAWSGSAGAHTAPNCDETRQKRPRTRFPKAQTRGLPPRFAGPENLKLAPLKERKFADLVRD
jgi:hypothetical protein